MRYLALTLSAAALLLAGCRQDQPAPTATPQAVVTPEKRKVRLPTPTPTRSPVPLPTWTVTPTPVLVPTPSPTPTLTPSPAPTLTPSPTPSPIPTATPVQPTAPPPTASPTDPPPVGNTQSGTVIGNGSASGLGGSAPTPTPSPTPTPGPTPTPTPAPTPTPTPPPTIPLHVQNAVYAQNTSPTGSTFTLASPAPWKQYLSWSWTPLFSQALNYQNAGIGLIMYVNPMEPGAGKAESCFPNIAIGQGTAPDYECGLLNTGDLYASVEATTCGGSQVTSYSGYGLTADPTTTQFPNYLTNSLTHAYQHGIQGYGVTYTLIFVDNDLGFAGGGLSAQPCTWSISNWGNGFANGVSALGSLAGFANGGKFIPNSLSASDGIENSIVNSYLSSARIYGGMYEQCFTNGSSQWVAAEDSQILTVAYLKAHNRPADQVGWWCYADATAATGSSVVPYRLYVYDSFLLTYDLHYSTFMESFNAGSNIRIFPEVQFVPFGPTIAASAPISSSAIKDTSGAYIQYFTGGCYYAQTKISNGCEIAVNTSGTTSNTNGAVTGGSNVTIPNPNGYAHQMTCTGGGLLDNTPGSCSFTAASSTTLAPQTGEVLVP